jgi:hypothetical protein
VWYESVMNEDLYTKAIAHLAPKISPEFRQSFVKQFAEGKSLITEHFTLGMQIRNALRSSAIFPKEDQLPQHFYDQTWMVLFLKALNFSEEDLKAISIEALLTNKEEYARWTGTTLVALYRNNSPLTPLCKEKLDEEAIL